MEHLYRDNGYHSERVRHHQTATTDDQEAVSLFNRIKDTYAQKIDELNELKRQVFIMNHQQNQEGGSYVLDHHARSKLRILIESLLIDLNEEIFALSEELARSFASFDLRTQKGGVGTPLQRALEFD
jgi:hypothetical protein